ncbi:MAG: ABC transporter permease subunit [Solobacterium sp.]|nr:ABC transporter permease subunit [Solobacterium sp.]
MSARRNKLLISLTVLCFWIGVWAMASMAVHQELLIPSPLAVARHLYAIVHSGTFLKVVSTSLLRVLGGFLCGCLAGVILAVVCSLSPLLNALLYPLVRTISAVPVTSFIILVMLWLSYTYVPVFIAALLVTPIVFGNVRAGITETDASLLEVAKIYRFSRMKTLRHVYIPSVLPYFWSGALTALGLAWKAGIAAEVLALPKNAIGSGMYYSKLYLETADLFAWTVIVVIFSFFFEKLMQFFMRRRKEQEEAR